MNIFATDLSPKRAALALDSQRVIKLILESGQMLSTAIQVEHPDYAFVNGLYRMAHKNHPCSIWARETEANYLWLCDHMDHLADLYKRAYKRTHSTSRLSDALRSASQFIPPGELTPFANCAQNLGLGVTYAHVKDPVQAYRKYLLRRYELQGEVFYKLHTPPKWVLDAAEEGRFKILRGVY